jgi:hypothetical protein
MKTVVGVLAGLALGVSIPATAGLYFGGEALISKRDYEDVDDGAGFQILGGYRVEDSPFFVEAGYINTGDAEIDPVEGATSSIEMRFEGFKAGVGVMAGLGTIGSGLWLKGGFYAGKTIVKAPLGSLPGQPGLSGELDESASGAVLGIGAVWKLTRNFGLRAEYESLMGVKDFAADEDVSVYSLGLIFEFPATKAAVPSANAPVYPAPAQQAIPAPAVASSASSVAESSIQSATAQAAPSAGNQPMRLLAEVPLRDNPKQSAQVRRVLPAGSVITLRNRMSNADGDWWYVQTDANVVGWIPATMR